MTNATLQKTWIPNILYRGYYLILFDVHSLLVVFAQCWSIVLLAWSRPLFTRYIAHTMRLWSCMLVALFQHVAPSDLIMTLDASCGSSLDSIVKYTDQGQLDRLVFPDRIIVTANHQIYADWIYIWCLGYLARAHGSIKIILKDSLKKGMMFFDFIFIKRKLSEDKTIITSNLARSRQLGNPLWLVLFPEGTVVSASTRERSQQYAKKNDLADHQHTLLPRSTGLNLCLNALDDSVEWLYDITIGYSGMARHEIPEEKYTLGGIVLRQQQPPKIHAHIRRFRVADIPKDSRFPDWINKRWKEKDDLLDYFYEHQQFPTDKVLGVVQAPIRLKENLFSLAVVLFWLLPYIPILSLIKLAFYR